MKLFNFIKITLLALCMYHAQAASSDGPKPASGIDPIALHGFSAVHASGITGKGAHIIFIENMKSMTAVKLPEELQRKRDTGNFQVLDCSHEKSIVPGAKDKSLFRGTGGGFINDECERDLMKWAQASYREHEIQTASLGVGTKGAAPQASFTGIHTGKRRDNVFDHREYKRAGASLYSYWEICRRAITERKLPIYTMPEDELWPWEQKIKDDGPDQHLASIKTSIEKQRWDIQDYLMHRPIDSSILDAMREATSIKRCIINMSKDLSSLTDPFEDDFRVPAATLGTIGSWLEASDSILVMAATNLDDFPKKVRVDGYLRSFAQHPVLGPRTLIAINLETQPSRDAFKTQAMIASYMRSMLMPSDIPFPHGSALIRPFWDSNIPCEGGWEGSAICALGNNIGFPDHDPQNGTSLSAPIVAGLAALIQEKYPDLSGPGVVQRIKDTAIKLGDPKIYGHGVINPLAAVGFA